MALGCLPERPALARPKAWPVRNTREGSGGASLFPAHFDDWPKTWALRGVRAVVVSAPV